MYNICIISKAISSSLRSLREGFMESRVVADSWIVCRPIAHRGLHGNGIGENTRSAFIAAIENGYPIETDVQLTSDGVPVCFHDDNALRVTGKDADIRDLSLAEVRELKICGTEDGVMTFKEFLELVDGRTPILVEIKQQKNGAKSGIERKVVKLLDGYKGEFAVQSFDPFVMRRVRKLRPSFLRGQLGGTPRGNMPYLKYFVVRRLALNFLSKPDFVNYYIGEFPIKTKLPVMRWTIDSDEKAHTARDAGHNVVFEKIVP